MKSMVALTRSALVLLALVIPAQAQDSFVRITLKPRGLVHGDLKIPVSASINVAAIRLFVNGVPYEMKSGRSVVFDVPVGKYIRRLRIRAVGYDAAGRQVDEDEMMINDPQPPFRVRLRAPPGLPERGPVRMEADVTHPETLQIQAVEFYLGENLVGIDQEPPWTIEIESSLHDAPRYARAVARTEGGEEENDIHFFGGGSGDAVNVTLHQIPVSIRGGEGETLTAEDLVLWDNGQRKPIEQLVRASEQPLYVAMLIDSSESMEEELPLVRNAASEFARSVLEEQDAQIAVVAFGQRVQWLTGYTRNLEAIDRAVERIKPRGQTHLYDAVIGMLYDLQKKPGRRALVVLSDGVNQGGDFELDHVVHYARYSGVPVYPIIRNTLLSRLMKIGLRWFEANRFAQIAEESGARYFIVQRPEELPEVYEKISKELEQQYLILFYAEETDIDRWHTLRVESVESDLFIRAPRGYFP
ncbi:MAG: VWA domain-containing protein [Thermoanaerobaculia bacterium]|nr:VWA domain-containing protein [Thermoanaerobaculia bacterium]